MSHQIVDLLREAVSDGSASAMGGVTEYGDVLIACRHDGFTPLGEFPFESGALGQGRPQGGAGPQFRGERLGFILRGGQEQGSLDPDLRMTGPSGIRIRRGSPRPTGGHGVGGTRPRGREIRPPGAHRDFRTAQGKTERKDTLAAGGLHRNDGHTKLLGETRRTNRRALCLGHVDHVESDDGGQAQLENLGNEVEIALQVGGIEDTEQALGSRGVLPQVQQHITGDQLVGGMGSQAIAPGKVEEFDPFPVLADELARILLNGDPGIVADFLPEAGEGIEEGGLARIRVAHDGIGFGPR